jgi:hypothetical protein
LLQWQQPVPPSHAEDRVGPSRAGERRTVEQERSMSSHDRVDLTTHRAPIRRRNDPAAPSASPAASHPLVRLQRSLGNATVARMLQREAPDDQMQLQRAAEEDELQMQRAAEEDELQMQRAAEEDELQTQRASDGHSSPEVGMAGGPISDGLSDRINAQRGGGSALDGGSRGRMEQAFGHSFEDVRVHTGSEAESLNRSVAAKAFTTGSDIFFGPGSSPSDDRLLAHELTHVVQQRGSTPSGGPMTVGPAGDHHEAAAEAAAGAVTSGGSVAREEDSAMAAQRMIAREESVEDEGEQPT